MKVVTEILQDLEILKRLLKHNANLKIRINYYFTSGTFFWCLLDQDFELCFRGHIVKNREEQRTGTVCEQIVIEEIVN